MLNLNNFPVLLLNADFLPVSKYPLSMISCQDAIRFIFMDKVEVLAEYEKEIHSPSMTMKIPSVVALREFKKRKNKDHLKVNRRNIFIRDHFTCQYCGSKLTYKKLQKEHIVPKSKGGQDTWTNLVAACGPCNRKKGSEMLMKPKHMPTKPNIEEMFDKSKLHYEKILDKSQLEMLYFE